MNIFEEYSKSKSYRNGQFEKSGNDYCLTPPEILDSIKEEFGWFFDPCPKNPTFNGLQIEWGPVNFVNPPYSEIAKWAEKCEIEWKKGRTVILLIPPRTCTRYFHDHIYGKAELRFIKGRVRFLNPETEEPMKPAPFPSMLCIFRGNNTHRMKIGAIQHLSRAFELLEIV